MKIIYSTALHISLGGCESFPINKYFSELCDLNIQVARDEDLIEQIGKDIYFDLVDHDKVRSFRIQKQLSFASVKVIYNFLCCICYMLGYCLNC